MKILTLENIMDRSHALDLLDKLSSQNAYYKSLDISAQLTQLNALKKLQLDGDLITNERAIVLKKCIQKRNLILQMSIDCLEALEEPGWLQTPEAWQSMIKP